MLIKSSLTHPVAFVAAAAHILFKLSHFPDNDHINSAVGGDDVDVGLYRTLQINHVNTCQNSGQ